ncbi:hypothetical protein DSM25559_3834 [Agrobacterium rosae]|uniref:Uncharacterized protein n=1 Tax=Agrobacterium rosae TaxID=1972867 RepID=A0A1R3U5W0_9HYPH|nr:hypothetical protein DSM25559_3834 [Agrobacterium rosae]
MKTIQPGVSGTRRNGKWIKLTRKLDTLAERCIRFLPWPYETHATASPRFGTYGVSKDNVDGIGGHQKTP